MQNLNQTRIIEETENAKYAKLGEAEQNFQTKSEELMNTLTLRNLKVF